MVLGSTTEFVLRNSQLPGFSRTLTENVSARRAPLSSLLCLSQDLVLVKSNFLSRARPRPWWVPHLQQPASKTIRNGLTGASRIISSRRCRVLATPEFKVDGGTRTELKANSFSAGCWRISTRNFSNTRAGFP